jgi:hypothetical protein
VLKARLGSNGYLHVDLSIDGKVTRETVHRLVAKTFIPNPKRLPEVNHTGKRLDNRASKLEWRSFAGHEQDKMQREQKGRGVHFDKRKQLWMAYMGKKFTGYYHTESAAVQARRAAVHSLRRIL